MVGCLTPSHALQLKGLKFFLPKVLIIRLTRMTRAIFGCGQSGTFIGRTFRPKEIGLTVRMGASKSPIQTTSLMVSRPPWTGAWRPGLSFSNPNNEQANVSEPRSNHKRRSIPPSLWNVGSLGLSSRLTWPKGEERLENSGILTSKTCYDMNRLRYRAVPLLSSLVFSSICLLTGCLPIPHTTERTPEISGRVLDAQTHSPIQRAKIFLVQKPHHTTLTDASGRFRLKETRNFHWAYITPEGDWPDRKGNVIEIVHPGYKPHGFSEAWAHDVGDILLQPKR